MIKQYAIFLVVFGITLVVGVCEFTDCLGFCRREVEIVPGLRWQYCSDRFSRLIWDQFGTVADGWLDLTFCDYGLYVLSRNDDSSLYLDLIEKRVVKGKNVGINLLKSGGLSIDAATAMGIYTNDGKILFEQALSDLRERIKRVERDFVKE